VSTSRQTIDIRGIPVEVVRKDIKNLHVGVYPPAGRVRAAAPMDLNEDAVRLALISRLAWIRRQRQKFSSQDRQSQRELVGGETHYVQGRRYRLDVVSSHDAAVYVAANRRLKLLVPPRSNRVVRERVLHGWYRDLLRKRLDELVPKWSELVGVNVHEVRIKRMRTKWGSCNAADRRIWINLELAKKAPVCLEYIVVHELVHLIERQHNDRFRQLMDRVMPLWRSYRDELNRSPLAHEEWTY
jgi:predicted metal-dependent hydrolase